MTKNEKKSPAQDMSEPVRFYAFRDNGRYKDDIFVAVNGKAYQIKRGCEVTVPRCVANVLSRSMEQDTATASMLERESREFTNAE